MSRSDWNDDEQDNPAPLPAHERAWRHPSEIGERAWVYSEPPLTIGRGLTAATGAIGGLLAMAVLWAMVPTQAGRTVVATARSTIVELAGTGLVTRTTVPATTTAASLPQTTAPHSGATTTTIRPVAFLDPAETSVPTTDQSPITMSNTVWFGIAVFDTAAGELIIEAVDPAGPAAAAGLKSGDVVQTLDGVVVSDSRSIAKMLAEHEPGDVVPVSVRHADGTVATMNVTLGDPKTSL